MAKIFENSHRNFSKFNLDFQISLLGFNWILNFFHNIRIRTFTENLSSNFDRYYLYTLRKQKFRKFLEKSYQISKNSLNNFYAKKTDQNGPGFRYSIFFIIFQGWDLGFLDPGFFWIWIFPGFWAGKFFFEIFYFLKI